MKDVLIRRGVTEDCPSIMKLTNNEYELHNIQESTLTVKDFEVDGFGKTCFFKTFVAETNTTTCKKIIGLTVYYFTYSVFFGRTIFMQNLFVEENFRNQGIGHALLKALVKDASESGCSIVNFHLGDWNQLAIRFYKRHGAVILEGKDGYDYMLLQHAEMIALDENSNDKANAIPMDNSSNRICKHGNVLVRKGERMDCLEILRNIKERAKFSKKCHFIQMTAEDLELDRFGNNKFYRYVIAEAEILGKKQIVGYGIYVFSYSYYGRCVWMDHVYINEKFRNSFLEKELLYVIIKDALDNGYKMIAITLDTLKSQNIEFYKNLGASNWSAKHNEHFGIFDEDAIKKLIA